MKAKIKKFIGGTYLCKVTVSAMVRSPSHHYAFLCKQVHTNEVLLYLFFAFFSTWRTEILTKNGKDQHPKIITTNKVKDTRNLFQNGENGELLRKKVTTGHVRQVGEMNKKDVTHTIRGRLA